MQINGNRGYDILLNIKVENSNTIFVLILYRKECILIKATKNTFIIPLISDNLFLFFYKMTTP